MYLWTKKYYDLEEDSLVTSHGLDKQLLTNQDQVVMRIWLPRVPSWLRKNASILANQQSVILPGMW